MGNCLFDDDGDGVCDHLEITGCSDLAACNYDAASTNLGFCDYPVSGYDCDGACIGDVDDDGACDEFEIEGCDDPGASNYESCATENDGSCTFVVAGCTYLDACNYDANATLDNGLCNWDCFGCTDETAQNFCPEATIDLGECLYCISENEQGSVCVGDLNDDGIRGIADLLSLLSYFGLICED